MDSPAQSHFLNLLTELPNEAPLQLGECANELSWKFDKSSNRYQLRVDDIPPEIHHIYSNSKETSASKIEVEGSRVQFQPSEDGGYVYMSLKFKRPDSIDPEPTTIGSQLRMYHLIDLHKLSCDCFKCQHSSSQVFPQNASEIRQLRLLLGQNCEDFDPSKEANDLCQKCKEVDFHGVFDPLGKGSLEIFRRRIKKWSLQYVLSQGTCPFCLFLSGLYRGVHSARSVHENDCIKITLRPTADLIYDSENSKAGCLVSKAGVVLIKKDQSIRRREVLTYLLELENGQFKGTGSNAFKGRQVCPTKETRFKLIKNWLRTCEECHNYACSAPVAPLHWRNNLRMVDSHTRSVICAPVGCRYIALSYVWGGFEQVRLTSRTIKAFSQPGGLDTVGPLAQTVSDAIQVCASIGEQYIWIDSLCIIQDDAADINSQIPQMGSIYNNATLTIVDAAGKDANSGLMGVTTDYASTPRQFGCSVSGLQLITVEWNVAANVLKEVWSKRAWTFQEKLVSKRMLFFGRSQVWFSCCTALWREDMSLEDAPSQLVVTDRRVRFFESFFDKDISYNLSNGSIGKTRGDQLATYNLLVKEYIGKQLTKSEDILNAFSGVEEILTAPLGSFISGLPAEFLSWALLWEMENSASEALDDLDFRHGLGQGGYLVRAV